MSKRKMKSFQEIAAEYRQSGYEWGRDDALRKFSAHDYGRLDTTGAPSPKHYTFSTPEENRKLIEGQTKAIKSFNDKYMPKPKWPKLSGETKRALRKGFK